MGGPRSKTAIASGIGEVELAHPTIGDPLLGG
jgi:hypothetical protein